ncbi:MAG TPA: translocation/assembly module TamB domain-containing protein [Opitutus sp.]|nr:translocation/assembly module TamB domain-containing protein [Opitutus sp.]
MRRILITLAGLAALLLVLAVTVPWWLGAAVAGLGPAFGLHAGHYARDGYARFTLTKVEVRRNATVVRIDRIEAETPVVWWWHRWVGEAPVVVASGWHVTVAEHAPATPADQHGWVPLHARLERAGDRLAFWLPRARAGAGVVTWPGGELRVASARWNDRTLEVARLGYRGFEVATTLGVPASGPLRLTARSADGDMTLDLSAAGATVTGTAGWAAQEAKLEARFPEQGWKPVEASLTAGHWNVPGARAKIGAEYASVAGSGKVTWQDNRLSAKISAKGEPAKGTKAPPLTVNVDLDAGAGGVVVNAAEAEAPGLHAHLTQPVRIDWHGRLESEAAEFTIDADLGGLPWGEGRGKFEGRGKIVPGREERAAVEFAASANDVTIVGGAIKHAEVRGRFEWPRLELASAELAMADGSNVHGSGGWDFRKREVLDAKIAGEIDRQLPARWWPKLPRFETARIDAQASGPLSSLALEGSIETTAVKLGFLQPLAVKAQWKGHGKQIEGVSVQATAGQTRIDATGSVASDRIEIGSATFVRKDAGQLALVQPANVEFNREGDGQSAWKVSNARFAGEGAAFAATVAWGDKGAVEITAHGISSELWRDVFRLPATHWDVENLAVRGAWDDGPVDFSTEAAVKVGLGDGKNATASLRAHGDAKGLTIESLRAAEGTGVIVNAQGRLPVTLHPAGHPMLAIDESGPLTLQAETAENPDFWAMFTEFSGIEVVRPDVAVKLSGTWTEPRGQATIKAQRVALRADRFTGPRPRIEGLDLRIIGDKDGLKLESGAVTIDGQAVRASGVVPLTEANWSELAGDPLAVARRASLQVKVPDADMAVVAKYLPNYLTPAGRLEIDATLKPGLHLDGLLRLKNVVSRPLGPLGILQDVNAEVRLNDRTVDFTSVTARMGGQLVTLQGTAVLREHGTPRLDLVLSGKNLPFVRKTGLLLRGNLDLTLKTPESGPPELAGTVGLRDSLFTSDVRSLVPGGTKEPTSRPPYFSISAEPLNRWPVNVTVTGERFLRVRTTLFNGTVSARFQVTGTLGEPRAMGQATVNDGSVTLPFASFDVKQGQVSLSPGQPFEPKIVVIGATRHYGYDLQMELTGPVSSPKLTFTSSPPLSAEQVLLMVMAGQAPQNEISTTERQRAARFGAYFGASLLGSFGVGDSGRLTISSGEDVSEQGHETYSIEYRLSDRWWLTGAYNQFDEYTAGLKWRVYTKGGKKNATAE